MNKLEVVDSFINAIYREDIEKVKQLIENLDINWQEPDEGYTFLHLAVSDENIEIVKILIEAGADITIEDSYGHTALQWAIKYSKLEIAKLLLDVYITKNLSYKYKTFCPYCKKFTDPELNKTTKGE
jgi:ankyrin repeat protein